jgi:hypothetical protein
LDGDIGETMDVDLVDFFADSNPFFCWEADLVATASGFSSLVGADFAPRP